MTAYYFLGNGDYSIKSRKTTNKPDGYGIWNNSSNSWHTSSLPIDFIWNDKASLISWLANRSLCLNSEENIIYNPYTLIIGKLIELSQSPSLSDSERVFVGDMLEVWRKTCENRDTKTSNKLEHTPKT